MGKRIHLVAESGADLSPELADEYGVSIVPMHVIFGGETKPDGSFPPEDVCSYYKKTCSIPKTSGASPEDFEAVFNRIRTSSSYL